MSHGFPERSASVLREARERSRDLDYPDEAAPREHCEHPPHRAQDEEHASLRMLGRRA